ncbi:MAG: ribonuclease D [Acidobacteriota bacterium]|nr:ribonuclease D [Acidobacteriota bacterium]
MIDSRELESLCDRWLERELVGLDTEFVRTRTFYARLGLIQVAAGDQVVLLDAVEIADLSPFRAVLLQDSSRKVLHSCGEDLGVFLHQFGVVPRGLFDTQLAAAMVGMGFSLSYQALVERILGVHLEKGETRSDWTARPLREAQLGYAALDVAYLEPVYQHLMDRLLTLGRAAWVEEEFERLGERSRHQVQPDEAYLRIKGRGSLDQRGQAILRLLCAFREGEARGRNLARTFVVRDDALLAVAAKRPRSSRHLRRIAQLGGNERKRYGDRFLEIVEEALSLPTQDLPERRPGGPRVPHLSELVKELQALVARIGGEMEIAPEILARRRVLEGLVRSYVGRGSRELPAELGGWRRDVVGQPALELLDTAA